MWLLVCLLYQNHLYCSSLNDEGIALLKFKERVAKDPFGALASWDENCGKADPCSWFGVECANGDVVSLNLADLCLEGTLAPELGHLIHIKWILLCNNTFSGEIPRRLTVLKELEVLDLSCNNFSGTTPSGFTKNVSILHATATENLTDRRMLAGPDQFSKSKQMPPKPPPASPVTSTTLSSSKKPKSSQKNHLAVILPVAIGGFVTIVLLLGLFCWRRNKIAAIGPWATGFSGQLQRALIIGSDRSHKHEFSQPHRRVIPKLKRLELEAACEDFSNVIGSSSVGSIYKGTLSNGIEIAVFSFFMTSAKLWSSNLEAQFRMKVDWLSKVNHKNFVNLLGYCDEEEPFARMLVFEYAPNGTLFEHLHIKEAEHLDWKTRLRISMGIAYCLDYMHQLNPPVVHANIHSSSVNLSEDYAAKISEFVFANKEAIAGVPFSIQSVTITLAATLEDNVYSFGLVLLETMTGRFPCSMDYSFLKEWTSDYLLGRMSIRDMIDPTLTHYDAHQLERIFEVIRCCLRPDPRYRPTMQDVATRLREVTLINPDRAAPRASPLWWAELELEVLSVNEK